MVDTNLLSVEVMNDLLDAEYTDEAIRNMSVEEMFRAYCEWNGISGWSGTLLRVIDSIEKAHFFSSIPEKVTDKLNPDKAKETAIEIATLNGFDPQNIYLAMDTSFTTKYRCYVISPGVVVYLDDPETICSVEWSIKRFPPVLWFVKKEVE